MKWTDDRTRELWNLIELLEEVSSINRGNRCLERIAQCISMADELKKDDLVNPRDSFINFLRDLAVEDRQ